MGRLAKMAVSGALVGVLALAGCGGSSSTTTSQSASTPASTSQSTPAATAATQPATTNAGTTGGEGASRSSTPKEHLPKVSLLVSSPVFTEGGAIPARYTCDGTDTSPPLRWKAIPHGTAELALFVLNLNSPPGGGPLVYWAVAGLKPTLHGVPAGRLPSGAIVGRNSLGQSRYTICPAKSDGEQHYVVVLFALQHPLGATPGFNADTLYKAASNAAEYKGLAGFSYQRR